MTMAALILPTIHLNGGSRYEAVSARIDAAAAVASATTELCALAPHLRDYPGDPERFARDAETHRARVAMLRTLRNDLITEIKTLTQEVPSEPKP